MPRKPPAIRATERAMPDTHIPMSALPLSLACELASIIATKIAITSAGRQRESSGKRPNRRNFPQSAMKAQQAPPLALQAASLGAEKVASTMAQLNSGIRSEERR